MMIEFLKNYAPLASPLIAILAFLRPELAKLSAWFRSSLTITPYRQLEIGLAGHGPTIGIVAHLKASGSKAEIHEMTACVARKRDGATHNFVWFIARPMGSVISVQAEHFGKMELALPLTVTTEKEEKVNYLFRDELTFGEMAKKVDEFKKQIQTVLPIAPTDQIKLASVRKSKFFTDLYSNLNRLCFWEEGEFQVTLECKNRKGKTLCRQRGSFFINREESEKIRINVVPILESIISILPQDGLGAFNFVWCLLKPES